LASVGIAIVARISLAEVLGSHESRILYLLFRRVALLTVLNRPRRLRKRLLVVLRSYVGLLLVLLFELLLGWQLPSSIHGLLLELALFLAW